MGLDLAFAYALSSTVRGIGTGQTQCTDCSLSASGIKGVPRPRVSKMGVERCIHACGGEALPRVDRITAVLEYFQLR